MDSGETLMICKNRQELKGNQLELLIMTSIDRVFHNYRIRIIINQTTLYALINFIPVSPEMFITINAAFDCHNRNIKTITTTTTRTTTGAKISNNKTHSLFPWFSVYLVDFVV